MRLTNVIERRNRAFLGFVLPFPAALALAVLAGWFMDLGFPDHDWWPLTLLGTAFMMASVRGFGVGKAWLIGALGGFSFYGIMIWWLTVYLGLIPWIALTLAQVFLFSLGMALIALIWRYGSRQWNTVAGRLGIVPALVGGAWTLREAVASVFPFGGFAWGRIAQSQSEGPLASLVAWVGTSGMSFLLAWTAALVVALVAEGRLAPESRAGLGVAVAVALLVWPSYPVTTSGALRVLAVQGNADAGLFAQYERGDNLRDHYLVTRELYGLDVDVVVWPENASDIDPLRFPEAAAIATEVSREMGAPLIVGTITKSGEETFNSILLWDFDDDLGRPIVRDQYDKIHPVPFAEYLPARDFFYPLAPPLFDMIPRDYSFGERDAVFDVAGSIGGVAICYDIVDDEILWSMMDGGASIIFAPTNNADFGQTDQSVQQLAIAKMRAIETGRSVVNISTVGTSAIMDPAGAELDRLPTYTEGHMVLDVPLATYQTPATLIGRNIELGVVGFTLAGLIVAGAGHYGRYRRGESGASS
jgi:apolipoprotein N-acyltransferase